MSIPLCGNSKIFFNKSCQFFQDQTELFDKKCTKNQVIVLYGAGNLGKSLAKILGCDGYEQIFFSDSNCTLWGNVIDNILVMSPEEAALKYGKTALFIVTIFNHNDVCDYRKIVEYFLCIGIVNYVHYAIPAWKYHKKLLPHYLLGHAKYVIPFENDIKLACSLFIESESIAIFNELKNASLVAKFDTIANFDASNQYFIYQITSTLNKEIVFADCGAYNGDTLRLFLEKVGHEKLKHYYAFEPDRTNFLQLIDFVKTLSIDLQNRITCLNVALSNKVGKVNFEQHNNASSCASTSYCGDTVDTITIDSVLYSLGCDFIKMDIEGFELQALKGSVGCIKKYNPKLAISAYHKPDDFFVLPNFISSVANYSLIYRKHGANLFDTVLYAI